jgi:hypothetical protein
MTQSWECSDIRISLGVYVLGAIDPAERAMVDAHVATCRDCRDELAGLAGLPALLARVNPDELSRIDAEAGQPPRQAETPRELISTVHDLAAARRRRVRWRYGSVAAAVVGLAAGVLGGVVAIRSPGPATAMPPWGNAAVRELSYTSPDTSVGGDFYFASEPWGTGIAVETDGIPVGTKCNLVVTYRDGTRQSVAWWMTWYDEGNVKYTASIDAPASQIASFAVMSGSRTLVSGPMGLGKPADLSRK